jgi:hypothetical protein
MGVRYVWVRENPIGQIDSYSVGDNMLADAVVSASGYAQDWCGGRCGGMGGDFENIRGNAERHGRSQRALLVLAWRRAKAMLAHPDVGRAVEALADALERIHPVDGVRRLEGPEVRAILREYIWCGMFGSSERRDPGGEDEAIEADIAEEARREAIEEAQMLAYAADEEETTDAPF